MCRSLSPFLSIYLNYIYIHLHIYIYLIYLGKWHCPWHYCTECGKLAEGQNAWCIHCPNAYCRQHRDGLCQIRIFKGENHFYDLIFVRLSLELEHGIFPFSSLLKSIFFPGFKFS